MAKKNNRDDKIAEVQKILKKQYRKMDLPNYGAPSASPESGRKDYMIITSSKTQSYSADLWSGYGNLERSLRRD